MATEKPWGQGFVSSAVLIELEKNAGKSHEFCEGGIAELLPKIMERTEQKYNSIDGNSYLMFVAKFHAGARAYPIPKKMW